MADGAGGLRIIDISHPNTPLEVGCYPTAGEAVDVAVAGSLVFVAVEGEGVQVVNVYNPSAPFEALFFDTPGDARGVALGDEVVYIADGAGGIFIYSLPPTIFTLALPLVLK